MMTDPAASRPGTHLDPDRMADLFERLLDDAAADEARGHLAVCPVCSADFALISGEAELVDQAGLGELAELLPPVTIPRDVVTRIEAALYREPPLGTGSAAGFGAGAGAGASAATQGASAVPPASGHVSAAARPRRRRLRSALGTLAGATLVIAGGFGVVSVVNNTGGNDKTSSSGAGSRAPSASSTAGPHAAGAAPDAPMSPQLGRPAPDSNGTSAFQDLSVEQQAQALLGEHLRDTAGTVPGTQCEPAGIASTATRLAGTETRYQGRTVWLLIYAKPGDPTVADVFVVDADSCTPGNPGQVIDQFEIPRG